MSDKSFKALLVRFWKATRGVVTVEFTILLPVVLLPTWGATNEVCMAYTVARKADRVGTTLVNVISLAPNSSLTTTQANNLVSYAASLFAPFTLANASILMIIAKIQYTPQTVDWSVGYNTSALAPGTTLPTAIPTNITQMIPSNTDPNQYPEMIVVRVNYVFYPPYTDALQHITGVASYSFSDYYYGVPRTSYTISNSGS